MRKMKYFKSSSKAELNISYRLQTLGNDRNPIEYLCPLSRVRPGGISPKIKICIFAPTVPMCIILGSLYLRPLSPLRPGIF